jgi:hypothetical protein
MSSSRRRATPRSARSLVATPTGRCGPGTRPDPRAAHRPAFRDGSSRKDGA